MYMLTCSMPWTVVYGRPICSGELSTQVMGDQLSLQDAQELQGEVLVLFAVVFTILVLKKALHL
jgi:membrane glycosyltransferase